MNKRILLAKRPVGMPDESTWLNETVDIPEPKRGEVLVRTHFISLDPAMRGWLNEAKSYIEPVKLNEVMRAGTIGEVVKANEHAEFKEGDILTGWGGVQQYFITDGKGHFKIDTSILPMEKYLGVLGMPGMTAYFGILEIGEVKEGETVLVSGAAGAVGSVVGQIAKIKGCRVVGIAGGPDKCQYVIDDLGFDACIDYKNESVYKGIKEHCPKGIDVFFDNVGGSILDSALARLRPHARVVICGAISQYNNTEIVGPKNYLSLLVNRATMKGMVVFDYAARYKEAGMQMAQWMMAGKLKSEEDVYDGIENFHETFLRLFSGEKRGKLLLRLKE